jgi:hypothetical protein
MSPGLDWLIFSTTYTQAHYWLRILCFWGLALCGFFEKCNGHAVFISVPAKITVRRGYGRPKEDV